MPPSPSGTARPTRATDTTHPAGAWPWLRRLGVGALDLLLPPVCVACDQAVLRQGDLCGACFGRMTFITRPFCDGCGLPFDSQDAAGARCVRCLEQPFAFRAARAAFLYDEGVRRLILPLKHGDQPAMADVLAPHVARAGADLLRGDPLLVPVPLHRLRLFQRRYNQAALLARAVGRLSRCVVCPDALRRVRATASLDHRGAAERRTVLADAFAVRSSRRQDIAGRAVVLVDDVMTSGATAEGGAAVLLAAGAASVDVRVAARVPLSAGGGEEAGLISLT